MSIPSEADRRRSEAFRRLDQMAATLGAISALISSVSLTVTAAAQVSAEAQGDLEQAYRSIEEAVQSVAIGGHRHGPHIRVVDVSPDIADYSIDHASMPHHGPLDVLINVRASAQAAGLLLSFGTFELPHTTTLQIVGNRGASELTVVSGATVANLANALWSIYPLTGVAPLDRGTGIQLVGDRYGSEGFVSVQLLHPTFAVGASGIYRLDAHDFLSADPDSRIPWDSPEAFAGVRDFGQDLCALVNGYPARGHGLSLAVWSQHLRLQTTLRTTQGPWTGHAFTLGTFRAFRILRD